MITLTFPDLVALVVLLITLLVLLDRQSLIREMKRTRREVRALRKALLIQGKPTRRATIPPMLRRRIIERCKCKCQYCDGVGDEANGPDGLPWHIDHVVPVSKGGPTHDGNLTLACESCNLAKKAMWAYDFNGTTSQILDTNGDFIPGDKHDDDTHNELEVELEKKISDDQRAAMYEYWLSHGESLAAVERQFSPYKKEGGSFHYIAAAAINAELRLQGKPSNYKDERPI